jgi:NADP-reducing hydrogenase subunit HndB
MKPLSSVEELKNLREQAQARLAKQEMKVQVKVHLGTCGIASGANKILGAFTREVELHNLSDVAILRAGCIGLCGREPVVTVIAPRKERVIYYDLNEDKVSRIVDEHLVGGRLVKEWVLPLD